MIQCLEVKKKKSGIFGSHFGNGTDIYINQKRFFTDKNNKKKSAIRWKKCCYMQFANQSIHMNKGLYIYDGISYTGKKHKGQNNIEAYLKKQCKTKHFLGFELHTTVDITLLNDIKEDAGKNHIGKIEYREEQFYGFRNCETTLSGLETSKMKHKVPLGSYYEVKALHKCLKKKLTMSIGLKKVLAFCGLGFAIGTAVGTSDHDKQQYNLDVEQETQKFQDKIEQIASAQFQDDCVEDIELVQVEPKQEEQQLQKNIQIGNIIQIDENITYSDTCIGATTYGTTSNAMIQENNQIYVSGFSVIAYSNKCKNGIIVMQSKEVGTTYESMQNLVKRLQKQNKSISYEVKTHLGYIYSENEINQSYNVGQYGWADASEVNLGAKVLKK